MRLCRKTGRMLPAVKKRTRNEIPWPLIIHKSINYFYFSTFEHHEASTNLFATAKRKSTRADTFHRHKKQVVR